MKFGALVGPFGVLASTRADCESAVNVWREQIDSGQGDNEFWLRKSAGSSLFIEGLLGGAHRGAFELNGHSFMVVGEYVYDYVGSAHVATYSGLANDGTPVEMAASQDTLMIMSTGRLFRLNSGAMTEIVVDFTPTGLSFLANYFVCGSTSFSQIRWSEDDGLTFPADLVSTYEDDANKLVGQASAPSGQLYMIGNRTTKPFYVTSNPNLVFQPVDGVLIPAGAFSGASVRVLNGAIYMLAQGAAGQKSVVRINGYTAERISNYAIEHALSEMTTLDDAIGMDYELGGHSFYRLTFPSEDRTFEFHVDNNEWSEIQWWDTATSTAHRHRASTIWSNNGKVLAGDHTNGNVYELSFSTYHDFGFPIRWERATPYIVNGRKPVSFGNLDLGMETGVGLVTPLWLNNHSLQYADFVAALAAAVSGLTVTADQAIVLQRIYDYQAYTPLSAYPDEATMTSLGFYVWGRDPQINLEISDDFAQSFRDAAPRPIGRSGERQVLVNWNGLGSSTGRVFRLWGDDPVPYNIVSADLGAS